ncbi:MAG: extracellular solute-binding protein [Candidatus Kaiserbacteria bacterium]|nr:extracellular solute-binding protein [Candidatus Kaiserbacteria bacterium]
MKISLFQGILFGVFGLAALIGLFVFATYTGKSSSSSGIGTVVIWGTLPKDSMNTMFTNLAQKDTTLKSVSYVQKDSATLPNDLASAIATGSAPDLVLDSQENLFALAKFITPISSATLPASTFTSSFIEEGNLFASSGGYYGIPFLVDPLVLFSNRSILSSAGIAKPPATWEALIGLVPNVAVLSTSRQITRGLIALGTYSNVHNARGILSALFLQTKLPISAYSSGGVFTANLGSNSSNSGQPGKAVVGFYTQFADSSKVSYTWNASLNDSQQAFLSGDLALYLGYASEARYFTAANPNLNFSVTPLPQPATATTKSTYGLVYAFMIPNGAKNASGAYQAAALLTNSAEQTVAASATGLAPSALNNLSVVPSGSTAAVAYAEALYAKGWLSPAPAAVDSIFSSMINSVTSGRSTIDTALVSAESSLSQLLQQ